MLGACSTTIGAAADDVVLRYYTPSEIIVPARSTGRFTADLGCVFFHYEGRRLAGAAALFRPQTRLSNDRRSILLPNGQSIPFGEKVTLIYERGPNEQWPGKPRVDETCGPNPIKVLNLEEE